MSLAQQNLLDKQNYFSLCQFIVSNNKILVIPNPNNQFAGRLLSIPVNIQWNEEK
jgi:hypothetical protein